VQLIPGLEGSTHINFGLTAQFLDNYFADAGPEGPAPVTFHHANTGENPYWMAARDRNPKTVRFPSCLEAYEPLRSVPNVRSFIRQVEAFRRFARDGLSDLDLAADAGLLVAVGKCLADVVYAQLVAEHCRAAALDRPMVSVIFHALIESLGADVLALAAMLPPRSTPRALLKRVVRIPRTSAADLEAVFDVIAARYGTEAGRPAPDAAGVRSE
jgi:acyl-CoA dehydrogenase